MSERNTAPEFHLNYLIALFYQVLISSQQGSKQRCQWPHRLKPQRSNFSSLMRVNSMTEALSTAHVISMPVTCRQVELSWVLARVFLVLRLGLSSTLIYVYRCTFVAIDTSRHGNRKLLQFEFWETSPGCLAWSVWDRQEMPNDRNSNSLSSQLSYAMNIDTIYWYYNIHIYIYSILLYTIYIYIYI